MADYNIKAEITADASGFESGVKKAEKASKNLSKSFSGVIQGLGKNGLVGALGAVGLASSGLSATLGSVIKVARQVSATMAELTNAYKTQLIAERQLDTAIQNNPYITGASSKALKQFASEMQKVSNYGDEQLIPMMANLVSLGRTESETMKIMAVAMDMSAGMGISLDTAITQLNATLNGNIGRLGQQNAELKDLTAEELKQGKAIEILGEKFKGLSSATADTSKQLQNIKGDFKEALGQFTLPSSDMWNKFWAGFYQRGIEAINKINAFMDSQIIGKKLANAITEQLARINPADIGGRIDYTRNVLRVIGDNELEALKNYLSGLKSLSAEQEIILKRIKAEEDSRYQSSINAKKEAEDKKAQADAEAQITAELQKQEEISKKKTDWASKLLDQRIEMLETERDKAMQLAEEEGRESYEIWVDYNNKILELKLERLEKEKEKALAEEGLTAEDKVKIEEYYSGETKKIYNDLGYYKKKKGKEEAKDEKSKFAVMVEYAKQYAQKIKQIFSKVLSTIKNAFSSVVNIFKKMFDFNIDDALDALLKVEDAILTFFVETLPRLPSFMSSVVYSIKTLLKTVKTVLKGIDLKGIITSVLSELSNNLPEMVSDLLDILVLLVDGAVDSLVLWVTNGNGLQILLDLILKIQSTLEDLVTRNLDKIVTMLEGQIENIANFLAKSLTSANKTLPKLIDALLRVVTALIKAVAEALQNEEFINSIIEATKKIIDALIDNLPALAGAIIQLIFAIVELIVKTLPEILLYLVSRIGDTLNSSKSILNVLTTAIGSLLKKIFTYDFWIKILSALTQALGEIVKSAFTFGIGGGGGSSGGGGDWWNPLSEGPNIWNPLSWFADGTNNASRGLAIVGEAGPELVKFRGGEQVLNNRNTNKALAEMGGKTINQNITFNNLQDTTAYAMMNQLKQYNRQMAINGVI